jgi:hypothetical protein
MVVRIRLGERPKPAAKRARNRRFAQGVAALLTPAALMALALAIWGIGADLKLTAAFAIVSGWFSHWQVWLVMAVALESCSFVLNRYAKSDARTARARTTRTAAGLP